MLPSTELKENQPAPHSVGIQLPTVEPMIIPTMITRFALIVPHSTPRRAIATCGAPLPPCDPMVQPAQRGRNRRPPDRP